MIIDQNYISFFKKFKINNLIFKNTKKYKTLNTRLIIFLILVKTIKILNTDSITKTNEELF